MNATIEAKTENNTRNFRAILHPDAYSNATFWKNLSDYKGGKLYLPMMKAIEKVSFTGSSAWTPDALSTTGAVNCPNLQDLVWAFKSEVTDPEDVAALRKLLEQSLFSGFRRHRNHQELSACFEKKGTLRVFENQPNASESANLHPGLIGHKDFVMPTREISARFWIAVVAMAVVGIAAIVLAFALLQAAVLAVTGVITAVVGSAALLGSIGLYRHHRNMIAAENENLDQQAAGWRPIP